MWISLQRSNVYKWSIEICCGGYILIQALLLIQHGVCSSIIPITWLSGAALSGGGSFYLLFWQYCWMCQHLGPWSLQVGIDLTIETSNVIVLLE